MSEGFIASAINPGTSVIFAGQLYMHPCVNALAPVKPVFSPVPPADFCCQQLLVLPPVQTGPLLLSMRQVDNIVFICLTPVSDAFPAIQLDISGDPQNFTNRLLNRQRIIIHVPVHGRGLANKDIKHSRTLSLK
jgi:hypothetical protein